MSFPGMPMPSPDDQQAQQPLFGQPVINPDLIKIQQAIAQQMMQQGQDQTPISSPFQLAHKALSPLLGQLMQQHAAKQQAQLEQSAMPEIKAAMASGDPLAALSSSQNPLVRQMVFQSMPEFMKQNILTQAEVGKRKLLDPLDVQKAVDIEAGKEPIAVKQAADMVPIEASKARAVAEAGLATKLREIVAGQAATYAGQAETKRHNLAMEGGAGTGGGESPVISTKADFDKLPSGTVYREPDGNTYRKP